LESSNSHHMRSEDLVPALFHDFMEVELEQNPMSCFGHPYGYKTDREERKKPREKEEISGIGKQLGSDRRFNDRIESSHKHSSGISFRPGRSQRARLALGPNTHVSGLADFN